MDTIESEIAARFLRVWSGAGGSRRKPAGAADERLLFVEVPAGGAPGGHPDTRAPRLRALVRSLAPLAERMAAGTPACAPRVVLVQEDPALLDALEEAVRERGWGHHLERVAAADPLPDEPRSGIALVEGDLAAATARLLHEAALATRALVRVAVSRPADLPFATVRALVVSARAELLLRLPLEELQRLDRYRTTPVADLPLAQRRFAEGVSTLLGDARFEWLPPFRSTAVERGAEAAVDTVAERFRAKLVELVPGALVRRIELPAGAAPGGGSRLVLVTHAAERALEMNRILHELRAAGQLPWGESPDPLVRMEHPGVIELFAGEPASPPSGHPEPGCSRIRTVDHVAFANLLAARFTDRVTLEEVMRCAVERDLFPEDVRRALQLLRRDRRARYRALTGPDEAVHFGEGSATAVPESRPRRRQEAGEPELW